LVHQWTLYRLGREKKEALRTLQDKKEDSKTRESLADNIGACVVTTVVVTTVVVITVVVITVVGYNSRGYNSRGYNSRGLQQSWLQQSWVTTVVVTTVVGSYAGRKLVRLALSPAY
jgi:magnesium-transporting ATPase (P-type)